MSAEPKVDYSGSYKYTSVCLAASDGRISRLMNAKDPARQGDGNWTPANLSPAYPIRYAWVGNGIIRHTSILIKGPNEIIALLEKRRHSRITSLHRNVNTQTDLHSTANINHFSS